MVIRPLVLKCPSCRMSENHPEVMWAAGKISISFKVVHQSSLPDQSSLSMYIHKMLQMHQGSTLPLVGLCLMCWNLNHQELPPSLMSSLCISYCISWSSSACIQASGSLHEINASAAAATDKTDENLAGTCNVQWILIVIVMLISENVLWV